jgi:hypothetical protein
MAAKYREHYASSYDSFSTRERIDFAYACGQACAQLLRGKRPKFSFDNRATAQSHCYVLIRDKDGNGQRDGFATYSSFSDIKPLILDKNEASGLETISAHAIWTSWQTQREVVSFIKGFKYLHLQHSNEALRSVASSSNDISGQLSEDAEVVKAVEGLLRTDSTAIALMAMDFPDERSVSNLTMERQLHLVLMLKFSLKAYALGKGLNETDFSRVWELLRSKYFS